MTPLDLILWACAVLIAVIILCIPAMIVGTLAIELRKRWRAAEQSPADRRERFRVRE